MSNEAICPECGTAVAATAKFCRRCGATLQGTAAPTRAQSAEEEAVLAKMTEAQKIYAGLLKDLKGGKIDQDTFRRGVLPHAVIVRDRDAWIMDASVGRWLYYDGVQIRDLDAERASP